MRSIVGFTTQLTVESHGLTPSVSDGASATDPGSVSAVIYNAAAGEFFAALSLHGFYSSSDGIQWIHLANQSGTGLSTAACPAQTASPNLYKCRITNASPTCNGNCSSSTVPLGGCSFSPVSPIAANSTGTNVTLTVTTTAAIASVRRSTALLYAVWLPLPGPRRVGGRLALRGRRGPRYSHLLLMLWAPWLLLTTVMPFRRKHRATALRLPAKLVL